MKMLLRDDLVADFARVPIGHPVELRYQLGRPNIGRRVAMARQAHGHVERLLLVDLHHLIDAAVAAHTTYTGRDMGAMVKIDVVGHYVDFFPRNRLAGLVGLPHQFQARALVLDLLMAAHAYFGSGDGRVGSAIDRIVAIETVHAELSGM